MKPRFIETGRIVTTHGLKGEVKIYPWCDAPDVLLEFDELYLQKGQRRLVVEQMRLQKNMVLAKFEGIDTVEEAQKLRNQVVYLDREEIELEEGVYFIQDLLGLRVVDADNGREYGHITDVLQTGANDVYEVKNEQGKTVLIPAIPDVIVKTDLEEEILTIRPLAGLIDDED